MNRFRFRFAIGECLVGQGTLLAAAVLVTIPAIMVFLSLTLRPAVNRWANIILGVLFTLVNVGNLLSETWAFYLFFGALEIALTALIVASAWRWPKVATAPREVGAAHDAHVAPSARVGQPAQ